MVNHVHSRAMSSTRGAIRGQMGGDHLERAVLGLRIDEQECSVLGRIEACEGAPKRLDVIALLAQPNEEIAVIGVNVVPGPIKHFVSDGEIVAGGVRRRVAHRVRLLTGKSDDPRGSQRGPQLGHQREAIERDHQRHQKSRQRGHQHTSA